MKKLKSSVLAVLALGMVGAHASESNLVKSGAHVNQQIGDGHLKLQIISKKVLKQKSAANTILPVSSPITMQKLRSLPQGDRPAESIADKSQANATREEDTSLLISMPLGLIGEQNIFGGVITKVTDKTDETLGGLKLTDLAPMNVRTVLTRMSNGTPVITLLGCAKDCDEDSKQQPLMNLEIVGYNQETEMLILDMAGIGKELDLISMLDPDGEYTNLKAISSSTTAVDYSYSTLVFDITTKMQPYLKDAPPMISINPQGQLEIVKPTDPDAAQVEFTVRWYLKLNSGFNPAFKPRDATPGVGFFKTERSKSPKITRFSTTNNGTSVKYYIKNVPEKYKSVFAGAVENWNKEFTKIIGRNLLTYEFIDATDPRSEEIVAGDIRYNVIEWDLNNLAGYGGLGPSIANQHTGETMSANVLIQGPTIIDLYTKWYAISAKAEALEAQGKTREANLEIAKFTKEAEAQINQRKVQKFALKLGKDLEMTIHSQKPELEDPMLKTSFEMPPKGVSFDNYMKGYLSEMLEHELGHNLGLRHNFKGNLGSYESKKTGSVSRSIMEYLGRPYRHLNSIGLYDKMAISYGYKGVAPKHFDWYCTDEDQASEKEYKGMTAQGQAIYENTLSKKTPECTKSDATNDPFSFWENRLERSIELLVDTHSASAPVWTINEIGSQVLETLTALTAYAVSAEATADSWTNFFGKGDRPEDKSEVKDYVIQSFKKQVCDPELKALINAKESSEAKELAIKNLSTLQGAFLKKLIDNKVYADALEGIPALLCE